MTVDLTTGKAANVAAGVQLINNVFGGSGNDTITGDGRNNFLKGNGGNDQLDGSDGADLLIGGIGNDNVVGNAGRDILIGGVGQDVLYGVDGDDILIGGATQHDNKSDVLLAMLNLWNQREFDYATRVDMLKNTGVIGGLYKLNAASMPADGAKDTLNGLADSDWFWMLGTDVADNVGGEFVN